MVEPHCSNFRIITAMFWVSKYLGILRYTNKMAVIILNFQCGFTKNKELNYLRMAFRLKKIVLTALVLLYNATH